MTEDYGTGGEQKVKASVSFASYDKPQSWRAFPYVKRGELKDYTETLTVLQKKCYVTSCYIAL